MEVRVFFWAPIQIQGYDLEFPKNPRKRVFAFLPFGKPPNLLWRGSLLPMVCEAARAFIQLILSHKSNDCCAAEREQAPSPQWFFQPSSKLAFPSQGALEKQYRLSLLQVFAMRQ
ncbi:hypothetical protein [Pseudomonas koreensis]|uniref:hypothetical protein n=1 Tax=Pseudomonas koreensis TaxID=198620 RepID=UPI0012FE7581|nr:hypothetical protein [Pseudomonas koreensis]